MFASKYLDKELTDEGVVFSR